MKLWTQEPLCHFDTFYKDLGSGCTIARTVGDFTFVPLICEGLHLAARLEVTLLRPEPPGSIISAGGDIDNRLKTLFDSLKVPLEGQALPPLACPDQNEKPFFFCLLQDDNFISELSVETAQLLEPGVDRSEVVAILNVTIIKIKTFMGGMELP